MLISSVWINQAIQTHKYYYCDHNFKDLFSNVKTLLICVISRALKNKKIIFFFVRKKMLTQSIQIVIRFSQFLLLKTFILLVRVFGRYALLYWIRIYVRIICFYFSRFVSNLFHSLEPFNTYVIMNERTQNVLIKTIIKKIYFSCNYNWCSYLLPSNIRYT